MNSEFKHMMQLAGLTEIRITPPNLYNTFWQNYLDIEEDIIHDDEELEVIKLFRAQNVTSLDDLADKIESVDSELTEFAGAYPGDFFDELIDKLKDLCDEMNFSQKDELIDKVKSRFDNIFDNDDDDDDDDDDDF